MEALQEWGIRLIQALQTLSPALDPFMEFFTFLGKVEFYMLFITFLYWIVDTRLGFRAFMVLLSTDVVGMAFKHLFHQPRPYWIGDVKQMGVETSYGIPSTHASDSFAVWGFLAYEVKRRWLWITAVVLVLLISFSRLYLGVHFPHDVVGGWLIGLLVLVLFVKYEEGISGWLKSKSTNYQVGLGFAVSIAFIALGLIVKAIITPSPDSEIWAHFSTEARSLTSYFTLAGAFFGAVAGYGLMKFKAKFRTQGPWAQKLGRYLVGIVGVLIAMYGLDAVFGLIASDESVLGYILRYIRYGTTTFWVMFGAPWVFLRLRLVNKGKEVS
jgi:membrane-associated phospholipid phosphatase